MTETIAIAHAENRNKVTVWCNIDSENDGFIDFSVINGVWHGRYNAQKQTIYIKETEETFSAVLVWRGVVPKGMQDYNEAITWIDRLLDGGYTMTEPLVMTQDLFKDIWRERNNDWYFEEIEDDYDDAWRHGNNHSTVFELFAINREVDWNSDDSLIPTGRYFQAHYQVSGDGEYHGMREGDFDWEEVTKEEKVVTKTEIIWHTIPKEKPAITLAPPMPASPKVDE